MLAPYKSVRVGETREVVNTHALGAHLLPLKRLCAPHNLKHAKEGFRMSTRSQTVVRKAACFRKKVVHKPQTKVINTNHLRAKRELSRLSSVLVFFIDSSHEKRGKKNFHEISCDIVGAPEL
jgi:hypothetical protein